MNNHAKVVFFFQYMSFLSFLFLFSHIFFVYLHPDKSIISQHNEKKHLPFRSLAGRFSRHDGSGQAGRHLGADALADRENAEDIGCRQGALQCHRCQQYRRLGEEPCQCRSCRHSLQRGDSCAAHPQSEELWPLLDVQRHERAACQLRQAHADSLAVEFSQDYLFFYDQLEKANLMLQGVIDHARKSIEDPQVQFFFKSPLNDGGTSAA